MRTMILIQRMSERLVAHLLRKSFVIRHLQPTGGGNFLTSPFDPHTKKKHFLLHDHLATAPCWSLFLCLSLLFLAASCEKSLDASVRDEGHPILYSYYQEATGLYQESVKVDSVSRFKKKVDAYTSAYPDSKQTWYYPEIVKCISQRLVTIDISFSVGNGGNWSDSTKINF